MAGQDPIPTWLNLHNTVREPVVLEDLEPVDTVCVISDGDMVEFRVRRDLIGTVPNIAAFHHFLRFGRIPRIVIVNLTDGPRGGAAKKRGIGARERERLVNQKVEDANALEERTGESTFMAVPIDPETLRAALQQLADEGWGF